MRTLVTGAGGLLGTEFAHAAARLGMGVSALRHGDLDVTDEARTRGVILTERPDLVIHCAAYTAVDLAETEPDLAFRVNRDGTRHAARAAADVGARFVYVSTDYVFDGEASRPYPPDAEIAPASVYARSKAAGEAEALALHGAVVVRTGWLYGAFGRNFVGTVVARAREGLPLRVVDDQRGRPSWTSNVVDVVFDLVEEGVAGVWHVADGGEATWLDLACAALRLAGVDGEVEGVSTEAWGAAATRPRYSVLDLARTERLLGRRMEAWEDALARFVTENGLQSEIS